MASETSTHAGARPETIEAFMRLVVRARALGAPAAATAPSAPVRAIVPAAKVPIESASAAAPTAPADEAAAATPSPDSIERFRAFVERARPLATRAARAYLDAFAPDARRILEMTLPHDVLLVAGYTRVETSYTRLAGWALGLACAQSALAETVQRALVEHLAPDAPCTFPMRVHVELCTEAHGTADLVLEAPELVIIVEAKTVTAEHEAADSGLMQLDAYRIGVPARLGVATGTRVEGVLLSIDGDAPAGESDGHALTFAALANLVLRAIEPVDASADEKVGHRVIATHWLEQAVPRAAAVREIAQLALTHAERSDREILRRLPSIVVLQTVLPIVREQA